MRQDPDVRETDAEPIGLRPSFETSAVTELRRVARLARTVVGAPTQITAVSATSVRRLAASPPDTAEVPDDIARLFATAEGAQAVTHRDGVTWFGAPILLRGQRVRAVLCAPMSDPGGRLRSSFADLASLAATVLRLEETEHDVEGLRELLGTASHDLRSPLSVLRAGLETLVTHADDLEPEQHERIATLAMRQARRMATMIDGMLALHGFEDGVQLEDVAMQRVVMDVLESGRLAHQLVELSVGAPLPDDPVLVRGVPDALARLLTNLVTNAAIHGHGHVWITLKQDADHAIVWIEDDGPGLPAGTALDGGDRGRGLGGHGLGLVIATRIVATHQATIHHEPRAGGGTRVVVTFPLAKPRPNS